MTVWTLVAAALLNGSPPPDSAVLSFRDFYEQVIANHPIVAQARLLEEIASGDVRTALGAFDPRMQASWDRKRFQGSEYFDYVEAALKVPTRFGFDFTLGYERADGIFINQDRRTPGAGLFSAGISLPVGQRLVTDERRAALAQAEAMRTWARGERTALINKLLFAAAEAYGEWYSSWQRVSLTTEGVSLADFRLGGTRDRVRAGESAAIDTLEARLELQRRVVQQREAHLAFANSSAMLESMLWTSTGDAAVLPEGSAPQRLENERPTSDAELAQWLDVARRTHPDFIKTQAKLRDAEAARALAMQRVFVPDARINADALSVTAGALGDGASSKIGASIEVPLWFRKERGKYQATSGKADQLASERSLVSRTVEIGIVTANNEVNTVVELIDIQRVIVSNAQQLRDAEQRKFENGESTLFIVNTRERTVLDEQARLITLETKYLTTKAKLSVAVGAFVALGELAGQS